MAVERIIGVDFGTSTSVVRVKRYENGKALEDVAMSVLFNGSYPTVPTVIQDFNGSTYYGYDALVSRRKSELHRGFKVNLESTDENLRTEARKLTEDFLKYLAKTYKDQSDGGHLGNSNDKERTLISYPVKWSDETKEFMIKAAQKAGFPNVEGMDEAQAAIQAVTVQSADMLKKRGYLKSGVPANILLIDMGAGTTDLVLCRHTPGNENRNAILCTWPKEGEVLFGGQEVEEILRSYVKELMDEAASAQIMKSCDMGKFKAWKENIVSPALEKKEAVEEFSDVDTLVDILDAKMEPYNLNRETFESAARTYLEGLPKLIEGCIKEAGIKNEDIDLVILTGGHSSWYFAKEMLAGEMAEFGNLTLPKIRKDTDRIIQIELPQETVALGLVYSPMAIIFEPENKINPISVKSEAENKIMPMIKLQSDPMKALLKTRRDLEEYLSHPQIVAMYRGAHVAVKPDGTVISDNSDIALWKDIISVAAGGQYIVGLKKDGTVVAAGRNDNGQCNVPSWRDIVSVTTGFEHMVGLKKDGTVVAAGRNDNGQCNVSGWRDIVSMTTGYLHTVGLKKDGTVVAAGRNNDGRCNVSGWRDIVSVAAGIYHTVGLKKDGTVVAAGRKDNGQCNVSEWRNIVSVATGGRHTVGLKKDGTVVAVGDDREGKCNVSGWRDIIAVSADSFHTIGVRKDGTVLYTDYTLTKKKMQSFMPRFFTSPSHKVMVTRTRELPEKLF